MAALTPDIRRSGFTLLELMAVLTIIGVLAAGTLLSLSGPSQRALEEEAERLRQALQMAADESVFQGAEMGAYVTATGYGFLRYDDARRHWEPLKDRAFRARTLPDSLRLALRLESAPVPLPQDVTHDIRPALLFLPSGEMTPFTLTLSTDSLKAEILLIADGTHAVARRPGALP